MTGFSFTRSIAPSDVTAGKGVLAAKSKILEAALKGLEEAARLGLEKSNDDVPVLGPESVKRAGKSDPGALRRSGKVEMEPELRRAAISYNEIYASLQHERLDYKHPNGGSAKFLERALLDNRKEFLDIIAAAIREETKG